MAELQLEGGELAGVRVHLEDDRWDEWIVGCADPESVAATLAPAG